MPKFKPPHPTNPPHCPPADQELLELLDGAALSWCTECGQLMPHSVDEVLSVGESGNQSEVRQHCLNCEQPSTAFYSHN